MAHSSAVRCEEADATSLRATLVDIVDLSTGVKFNPFASANIYLLAIIPLTQQGLGAAAISAAGFEWTF